MRSLPHMVIFLLGVALLAGTVATSPAAVAEQPGLQWHQLPPLPDELGYAGPYAGVSHGVLLFAGGANFAGRDNFAGAPKVWYDEIWVLNGPDGQWRKLPTRLPSPLGYGVALTWHDQVLCLGGENQEGERTDAFTLTWTGSDVAVQKLPPLPQPDGYLGGVMIGDVVYLVGGFANATTARHVVWTLDMSQPPAARAWKEEPTWPGPALAMSVVGTAGGSLYVFGGATMEPDWQGKVNRVFQRKAYRFTPGQGWSRVADMPATLAGGPTPAPDIGGRLLVLGGDDGGLFFRNPEVGTRHPGYPATVYAYDPATNAWSIAGKLPVQPGPNMRTQPAAAVMPPVTTVTTEWHGMVIIPSGEIRPGTRSPQVLALSAQP